MQARQADLLGTPQSVRRFDSTMVRDFYNAVYAPANVLVTAAGHLTHDGLTTLVRAALRFAAEG